MNNLLKKINLKIIIITFLLLLFVHFPLLIKNIISADILLNNYFYNGYSWEVSLGRFGLYIIGIIKSYLNIAHVDLIISFLLITFSTLLIIDLFEIKSKINKILCILIMCISPIISSMLLFNYCSIGYLVAFLFSILSIYVFYKFNNKYIKYSLPTILIIISLSMYQAYLSLIVTTYIIYNIKLLIDNNFKLKKFFTFLICLFTGVLFYFVLMKISLLVFHVDMSNYSNADKIGLYTIFNIPNKIIDSYKLFYNFYFTDKIMKNTYMHNNIINIFMFITFIINIILNVIKNKTKKINLLLVFILIILLPIFLNSVIFVINDSKLQLLMSSSYLLIPIFIISINNNSMFKYFVFCIFILLLRNNFIQDQCTYLSLENTFNKYDTIIRSAINNNINNLDNEFIIIGDLEKDHNSVDEITKMNYGFVSDLGIFWDEYNLRKIAFEKFTHEYYGLNLKFGSEEDFNSIMNDESDELIYNKDNIIVINFYNY